MNRWFKYIVLIFVWNLWASNISAFEVCKTDPPGNLDIKWNTPNVTYYINTTGGPSGSLSVIQAAMQTWTDVTTSSFTFIYGGATSSTAHGINDGANIVTFGAMGTTGTLAENAYWYYVSTGQGRTIDSDIRFNTDYAWATTGSSSAYDVQNIGTHEHGHSLCLADLYTSADSEKTMYGYGSVGETKQRTLDPDDINGIAYLYDITPPSNTTGTNFVNSGATSTNSTSATLSISATDNVGVTGYYASETSTTPSASADKYVVIVPPTCCLNVTSIFSIPSPASCALTSIDAFTSPAEASVSLKLIVG